MSKIIEIVEIISSQKKKEHLYSFLTIYPIVNSLKNSKKHIIFTISKGKSTLTEAFEANFISVLKRVYKVKNIMKP